ncbi:MAG: Rhomboid family protein [Verrucomicrobia bacterium]|nr:Rhomboid family protein [Verrucomicrobiota bacterium]
MESQKPARWRSVKMPWATLIVAAAAGAVFTDDPVAEKLVYLRTAIVRGEFWRLWTGNLVHFSASHLAWNLAVLLPAGIWAERIAPSRTRWFFALAPAIIGLALLILDPSLAYYGGLSGLAAGALTLLALTQLARKPTDPWFWWAVLVLLALKIVVESSAGSTIFPRFNSSDVRTVPLAHAAGIVAALLIHFRRRRI